jgi:hypothetical protein
MNSGHSRISVASWGLPARRSRDTRVCRCHRKLVNQIYRRLEIWSWDHFGLLLILIDIKSWVFYTSLDERQEGTKPTFNGTIGKHGEAATNLPSTILWLLPSSFRRSNTSLNCELMFTSLIIKLLSHTNNLLVLIIFSIRSARAYFFYFHSHHPRRESRASSDRRVIKTVGAGAYPNP